MFLSGISCVSVDYRCFKTPLQFLLVRCYRICLPMQETWVQSLGRKYPLEKEIATHSHIFAREIPWTEEPDGL